jgi:hypothetical protein
MLSDIGTIAAVPRLKQLFGGLTGGERGALARETVRAIQSRVGDGTEGSVSVAPPGGGEMSVS